jgi:type II secretion system protein H
MRSGPTVMSHRTTYAARRRAQAGFSLMELAVVVICLAIMTAMVTPIFRTTMIRLRTEQGINEFLTAVQYAQERAVSDGREFRIYIDARANRYWIERFVEVDEDNERVFEPFETFTMRQLPDEVTFRRVSARTDRQTRAQYITCFPSGACDHASITLDRANGRSLTIDTRGRIASFRVRDRER